MHYIFIENPGAQLAIKTAIDADDAQAYRMFKYLSHLAFQHEHDFEVKFLHD